MAVEVAGDVDDGAGDLPVVVEVFGVMMKEQVELEGADGEMGEVAEAGVARAEVVRREADTLFLQLLHDGLDLLEGVDEHAFRDFEFELLGVHAVVADDLP